MTRRGAAARPRLIMVVDDEPAIVGTFSTFLEYEGYATVPASTAEDALRLVRSGVRPDAILLDLRMPGMGGLGFLLALRAEAGCGGIPVAVVTADTRLDDTTAQAVTAMSARLLFKPVKLDQLLGLTQEMLGSRRSHRHLQSRAKD